MSTELALASHLRRLVVAVGIDELIPNPEDVDRGMTQIESALRRVAVEADDAGAQGRSLAEACRDDVNYPSLYRLHVGARDILTMALPKEVLTVLVRVMDGHVAVIADDMQTALGRLVVEESTQPVSRALARVLLYQGIRINLIAQEHLSGRALTGQGFDSDDVDRLAEEQLAWWIQHRPGDAGDVRPLNVLVAAAMVRLEHELEAVRPYLHRLSAEVVEQLRQREELELVLRRMNTADALLIRNDLSEALGDQHLTIERLQYHHQLALGDRTEAALHQQAHRLREHAQGQGLPERRSPSLIDLLERRLKEAGK